MDNCATTLFRLQLLERLFPFILPKMFLPPTLNMKNEGRDAFFPLLLHLLFFSRESLNLADSCSCCCKPCSNISWKKVILVCWSGTYWWVPPLKKFAKIMWHYHFKCPWRMTCPLLDNNILLVSCCRQVLMDNCATTLFRLQLLLLQTLLKYFLIESYFSLLIRSLLAGSNVEKVCKNHVTLPL